METLMAFTVGVMAAGSVYLLLSHNLRAVRPDPAEQCRNSAILARRAA